MRSERWCRAAMAGGHGGDPGERWTRIVAEAIETEERHHAELVASAFKPARPDLKPEVRHVLLRPGQVVVDAELVLNVEMALVEAQQLADEIKAMASEDAKEVDAARRVRLLHIIEQCRERVARKLRGRGEA